jgi:hypothetical protein
MLRLLLYFYGQYQPVCFRPSLQLAYLAHPIDNALKANVSIITAYIPVLIKATASIIKYVYLVDAIIRVTDIKIAPIMGYV